MTNREKFEAELAKRGVTVERTHNLANTTSYWWNGTDWSVIHCNVYASKIDPAQSSVSSVVFASTPEEAVHLFARRGTHMIYYNAFTVEKAAELVESIVKTSWWRKSPYQLKMEGTMTNQENFETMLRHYEIRFESTVIGKDSFYSWANHTQMLGVIIHDTGEFPVEVCFYKNKTLGANMRFATSIASAVGALLLFTAISKAEEIEVT